MPEKITQKQYRDFKAYMRKMVRDIASAKTAGYINAPHMQELAIVWNAGDRPKLKGYPRPENLTHIPREPHLNHLEAGEYVFKRVIQKLMVRAGFEQGDEMFISEFGKNQFECTMYSSLEKLENGQFPSRIDCFFIRANGTLDIAQDYFKNLDDAELDEVCRETLEDMNFEIGTRKVAPVVPGLKM